MIEVRTQAELDQALRDHPGGVIACVGNGHFTVRGSSHVEAWGSSRVEAWGSSRVEAWGSSRVVAWGSSRVVAWGSSSVVAWESSHVVAWGSSSVVAWESSRVEAWGSSRVVAWGSSRVVAWESSHVEAWESSSVEARESSHVVARGSSSVVASRFVAVQRHDRTSTVKGGVVIDVVRPANLDEWFDYYGVKPMRGVVTLYKAVDPAFVSKYGTSYAPGSAPVADDWDGGAAECGGGLHFSPSAGHARAWRSEWDTRFVACPVRVKDIAFHTDAQYPEKVKARAVCKPCWEVDVHGDPVVTAEVA